MKEKILIFESRALCYHSADFFMNVLGEEFNRQGIEVEYVRLESIEKEEEKLRSYIGKKYLAVFDVNSDLTLAYLDDKKDYYLNLIQAPFYHIILDHPIHLQEKLKVPLRDYHVICIDENHAQYIKKVYPHIKDVFVSYYAGQNPKERLTMELGNQRERFQATFPKRSFDLFFPATYIPESYFLDALKEEGKEYALFAEEVLAYITMYPSADTITACQELCREKKIQFHSGSSRVNYHLCLIDRYVRAAFRSQLVTEVLKAGKMLHVAGANWEHYPDAFQKNLVIHKPVPYQQQKSYLSKTKLLLNIQPLFLDGPHDRILNGFLNQNAVFTDSCGFLRKNFTQEIDYFGFERNQMEKIPAYLCSIWDEEKLVQTAWNGYQKASESQTWAVRMKNLFLHIKSQTETHYQEKRIS